MLLDGVFDQLTVYLMLFMQPVNPINAIAEIRYM
jgi:hypothetical protein